MIRDALLLGGLLVSSHALSAEFTLLRTGHPRLDIDQTGLGAAREDAAAVQAGRGAADAQLTLTRTTSYQDFWVELPSGKLPKPHPGDPWPYWTGICAQVGGYLSTTARAYALTGDGKYLAPCKELALAVAAWPKWTDPDYGSRPCLDTHSLLNGMSRAYDYLYPALSEEERATIRGAIVEKGIRFVFTDGQDRESYVFEPNAWPNGHAVINSSMGVGSLAVMGDVEGAEEWLSQAVDKCRLFFDQQAGKDGGLLEGFMYGSFAIDTMVEFLRCLHDVTGFSLLDHPYLDQAIYFPAYFVAPGGGSLPAIADNGGPAGCLPTLLGLARMLVDLRKDPVAAWYLKQAGRGGEEIDRLGVEPADLPLGRHFASVDWVALRSGWGPKDALMALKCGSVKSHNHLDQNSFLLAWGTEWLLNDPGYQIYDMEYPAEQHLSREVIRNRHVYTAETPGHNTILVDGQGQSWTPGAISRFFTSSAMTYAAGDASGPYQGSLKAFMRHVVSLPGDDYFLYDEIATDGTERAVETLFHTTQDGRFLVGEEEPALDQALPLGPLTVRRTQGEVRLATLLPSAGTMTHKQWPDCEAYGHYVAITAPAKATALRQLFILRPGPRDGTAPIEAQAITLPDAAAALSRHGAGSDLVVFNPSGQACAAGDVQLSGVCGVLSEGQGVTRAALVHGLELRQGDRVLLAASRPASVARTLAANALVAEMEAEEATDITIACPIRPEVVELEGVRAPVRFEHDRAKKVLRFRDVQGRLRARIRALSG